MEILKKIRVESSRWWVDLQITDPGTSSVRGIREDTAGMCGEITADGLNYTDCTSSHSYICRRDQSKWRISINFLVSSTIVRNNRVFFFFNHAPSLLSEGKQVLKHVSLRAITKLFFVYLPQTHRFPPQQKTSPQRLSSFVSSYLST